MGQVSQDLALGINSSEATFLTIGKGRISLWRENECGRSQFVPASLYISTDIYIHTILYCSVMFFRLGILL